MGCYLCALLLYSRVPTREFKHVSGAPVFTFGALLFIIVAQGIPLLSWLW